VKPIIIDIENKIEPIQVEHATKPINLMPEVVEEISVIPEDNLTIINIEKKNRVHPS
jgi:hypothetical protein